MIEEVIGIDTARPMVLATNGSVGAQGQNLNAEVLLIQSLLNNVPPQQGGPSPTLAIDGRCGPFTIAAIHKFQKAKLGSSDGRVDARNRTIRLLVGASIDPPRSIPPNPGLRSATLEEAASARAIFDFPFNRIQSPQPAPQSVFTSRALVGGLAVGGSLDTGFGAPFTPSGWTIDNSVGSFDITVKNTGVYAARMEIFQDKNPSIRAKLSIAGVIKNIGSKGPPFGVDIALPSFPSTQGTITRGLNGFVPISPASFFGPVGVAFLGISATFTGLSATFFEFGFVPAGPPGLCLGFALMAGKQAGIPGAAVGGGTGICVPI